jgi:hypothetical protein
VLLFAALAPAVAAAATAQRVTPLQQLEAALLDLPARHQVAQMKTNVSQLAVGWRPMHAHVMHLLCAAWDLLGLLLVCEASKLPAAMEMQHRRNLTLKLQQKMHTM